jgi:uncharacterized Ntn-hydrolase superfamily protein
MTYSIVARDRLTGEIGVAVQSHYFSVGSVVTWAEAGVGAVATQSLVNVDYGPQGVALMRDGRSATEALAALVQADDGRDVRQVAMIDAQGNVAAHTGPHCIAAAGQIVGDGFSVQANMMTDETIWPAMRDAYLATDGDLGDRMLAALDAAQAAGGDIRGQQSAAVLIVQGDRHEKPWRGIVLELRVEDHPQPLDELRRLLRLKRAYAMTDAGDEAVGTGDVDGAMERYRAALELAPDNDELQFWAALALYRQDRRDEAERLFRAAFAANPPLADLVERVVHLGIVRQEDVPAIVAFREHR